MKIKLHYVDGPLAGQAEVRSAMPIHNEPVYRLLECGRYVIYRWDASRMLFVWSV
jgi:hypothetical protein